MTMADEANLKDTVVTDQPSGDPKPADDPKKAAPIAPDLDPEAVEIGRILRESGVTKDQINDLLTAPKALESLRAALQGNPEEFFNMLQRTDAKTEENLLQAAADRFVKRYDTGQKPDGKGKPDANSDLMREVAALREEVSSFKQKETQRERNAALAATFQRYNARVDDMFGHETVKALGLTKSEQRAMRAQLDAELAKDPSVVQRASNGNFVDVPSTFKTIVESWANDKKEAAESAKKQADRVSKNGFSEFSPGANPFMNVDIPAGTSDSWDSTESGFAQALERLAR